MSLQMSLDATHCQKAAFAEDYKHICQDGKHRTEK